MLAPRRTPHATRIAGLTLVAVVACRAALGIESPSPFDAGDAPEHASEGGPVPSVPDVGLEASSMEAGSDSGTDSELPRGSPDARLGEDVDRRLAHWPVAPPDLPDTQFVLSDQTAFDTMTGLLWQRHIAAQAGMEFVDAAPLCASLSLEGETGFRLPTKIELLSLVDYGQRGALLDPTIFPDQPSPPADTVYWTATRTASASQVVHVDGASGGIGMSHIAGSRHIVRCVKLGKSGPSDPRYEVTEETVLDPRTRLLWQRTPFPKPIGTAAEAEAACAGLTLHGGISGFRMPTIRELLTLLDDATTEEPRLDPSFAPGPNYDSRSGTERAYPATAHYFVNFRYGNTYPMPSDSPGAVRCVKSQLP